MSVFKRVVIAMMIVSLALPLAACEKEGPAEKAGKEIDQAVDSAKDKAKELFGD